MGKVLEKMGFHIFVNQAVSWIPFIKIYEASQDVQSAE